ncbi:hypothetical protein C8Q77DRAFT_1074216 [Trametes polyzona]|nr:hypothetical protein C8Q77DRAFT_1074216 [Trametes polyzona]
MTDFHTFKMTFKGDLVTLGDPEYLQAPARCTRSAASKAANVAFVKDAHDVAAAITYAKAAGLLIAIRGGGNHPGGAASGQSGLVIDLSRYLVGARIDPKMKLAYVGGGAVWETVNKAAIKHGLATVGGTANHVGISVVPLRNALTNHSSDRSRRVLILGGGYGWLSGLHDLAIGNLVQATVVTADGAVRTANATENSDLFWNIRGAGSNFGVVTEFVLQLHPQHRTVFGGHSLYPPGALEPPCDMNQEWRDKGAFENERMMHTLGRVPGGREVHAPVPA